MELWTGALSWWKCHWPDLKSAGLFRRNLLLNSLKSQHSNPNPLAYELWFIDFLTPPTPLIIPHRHPCLTWISYASQKPMLDSCKMVENQSEAFHTFTVAFFFKFKNRILLHTVLLKCPHFQIAFLKFTQLWQSGCIPIAAVAVYLNLIL